MCWRVGACGACARVCAAAASPKALHPSFRCHWGTALSVALLELLAERAIGGGSGGRVAAASPFAVPPLLRGTSSTSLSGRNA